MLEELSAKQRELNAWRPLSAALEQNLTDWFRVELTYNSNAIEGNTLTLRETAMVVEKGLSVGGKSLREHLEAKNHARAFDWILTRSKGARGAIGLSDLLHLHAIILHAIDDANAGKLRNIPVRLAGARVVLPNPRKVPDLMREFMQHLAESYAQNIHPVTIAADAHYRLVSIHPFTDGNGRTARLLMNWILLQHDYPPAIIRNRERLAYLDALEQAQTGGARDAYLQLIYAAVMRSLDMYLSAVAEET